MHASARQGLEGYLPNATLLNMYPSSTPTQGQASGSHSAGPSKVPEVRNASLSHFPYYVPVPAPPGALHSSFSTHLPRCADPLRSSVAATLSISLNSSLRPGCART
jgi:hypothetical protein